MQSAASVPGTDELQLPLGQSLHVEESVAPNAALQLPVGQSTQSEDAFALHFPALHCSQLVLPGVLAKEPAGHWWH
jgi:hypothetical protein